MLIFIQTLNVVIVVMGIGTIMLLVKVLVKANRALDIWLKNNGK